MFYLCMSVIYLFGVAELDCEFVFLGIIKQRFYLVGSSALRLMRETEFIP